MRAIPASLRLRNQGTLVDQLLRRGVATRAELAKATGMSQPTAGKIIDELLSKGVVESVESEALVRGSVGRPGRRVRLSTSPARLVILEVGVERTALAAQPLLPPVEEQWRDSFKTPAGEVAWQNRVRAAAAGLDIRRPWGVVVSVPAIVDEPVGKVLVAPNLHWLEQTDLRKSLGGLFRAQVSLIQEIKALALGQLDADGHRGDFLLVDVGDGVGGAVVLGQRPYAGPLPVSGEIGHTRVRHNERACGCGRRGCLETLLAEPGLLESYRKASGDAQATWPALSRYLAEQPLPTWLVDTLDASASCIGAALNLYGLRRVVLTGKIGDLPLAAREYLSSAISKASLWSQFQSVEVAFAPRRRARGLVLAGIQRFVAERDWARS
ncbi:MAG TPA: ROK family transcriptional regulator [Polyangiaceae bacterium]|jgi:predicted NBD/HSP70 family sugar kinase